MSGLMMDNCDFCLNPDLTKVYTSPTTKRGSSIYLCERCGLVQSLPRISERSDMRILKDSEYLSTSSGADFGNLRMGKVFRAKPNLDTIREIAGTATNVLDVGASRGAFYLEFRKVNPTANYTAIEIDKRLLQLLKSLGIAIIGKSIEEIELPEREYDFIYCSHTLEHLISPRKTLMKLSLALTDKGHAFFEVPNLAIITRPDFVEEFFIDKHRFHFTELSFVSTLISYGFRPIELAVDDENIGVLVRPQVSDRVKALKVSVDLSKKFVETYLKNRKSVSETVSGIADRLNKLAIEKCMAVWGAGRILDALVQAGFHEDYVFVVDSYLEEKNWTTVYRPDFLRHCDPEVIVIASRTYKQEIAEEARKIVPEAEIKMWDEI